MKSRQAWLFMVILLLGFVTLGCAALSRPPEEPPAGDDLIATAVEETLAVRLEQTAEAAPVLPTEAPTPTPSPMPTSTPVTPTVAPTDAPFTGSLVVAYTDSSRNIWVWRPGETPQQITSFGDVDSVKVSDDATWIAFTRTTDYVHYELWVIRSDGSSGRPIMDQPGFAAIPRAPEAVSVMPASFGWKPGGENILAFTTRPTFEGPGLMMNNDLWLADVTGETTEQILAEGNGGQFHFSPDGAQIALVQPDSISLVDADGSNYRDRVFVYPQVLTYSEYAYYAMPVWAPDSSYMLVVIPPQAALENPDDPAVVWRISLDGSPAESLGSFPSPLGLSPVLAPNLEKLVYLRLVGEPDENRRELHVASPDGTGDELYQEGTNLTFQGWAPGSERFLFSAGDDMRLALGQPGEPARPVNGLSGFNQARWVDDSSFLIASNIGSRVELRLHTTAGEETLIAADTSESTPFLQYDFSGVER